MSWLKLNRKNRKIYQKSMAVFLSAMLLITSLITFFPGMGGVAEAHFLTYTVANIDDQTLAALTEGYTSGSQETKTITVTRTGTGDLTNLATALSGTNAGDFEITQPADSTLNDITPSVTLAVKARDGLAAGTYTATVTVSADNMTDVTFAVNQVVNEANNGYYTWSEVGSARFSVGKAWYPNMAVAGNGTPYVVFGDESNDDKATVMKYDGANWEVVGNAGFSAGGVEFTSIALDSQNTPYVVYQDVDNNYKATVMKYNGSNWEDLGSAGFSAGKVTLTSIAIDSDDKPYVVYQDWGNGQKATVMKYTGTEWEAVGSAGFSTGIAWTLSLALDSSNTPYVAYIDAANDNKATVMIYDEGSSSWEAVGSAGFSAGEAEYISIAIEGNGTPYVVYQDNSNDNKATVMKFNGSGWELVGSPGFSVGSAASTNIAIDSNGTPYVAYQDSDYSDRATVMKYAGINWEEIGSASLSDYSGFIRIAIDSSDTPYVVIQENGSYKATVLKYGWVAHTYAIEPIENRILPLLNEEYADSQSDFYIQIEKTGTGPLNNLAATISGANADAFEIAQPFVTTLNDETPNTQFTVKAKDGLTIGTYTATVTVSADNMTDVTFTVTQDVIAGDYAIAAIDDQMFPVLTEGYAGSQQWIYIYVQRTGASQLTNLATAISGDDAEAFEMTQPFAVTLDQSNFAIKTKDGLAAGTYTATVTVSANNMTDVTFTVTQEVLEISNWQWSNVGSAGFTASSANDIKLAIDKNDTLFVVYRGVQDRATVMKYDETSSSWVVMGSAGFSAGQVSSPNVAIDSSGTPYVVYRDVANANKVTVMKYDETSSSWMVVGSVGFSAGAVWFPDIAIDNNGTPYVVYQDSSNGQKATVMKYNGASWVNVGSPGFSAGTVGSPNIVMDNNDMPYVAFNEGPSIFKATVMKYNGSNWVAVGSTRFSEGSVSWLSMALDSNDMPYVVYRDGANDEKATVMQYDGTAWVTVGSAGFSNGQADYTSIAIDGNDLPYVVYQDYNVYQAATAMKYDEISSDWVVLGNVGFSEGGMQDISIAIDSHNTPYVAFRDWAKGHRATVMKYGIPTYTVTYHGNGHTGGTEPTDSNSPYEEGAQVTVLDKDDLVKDGYTFTGWNTLGFGNGDSYAPGATFAMPGNNVILYAQWNEVPAGPPAAQPTNMIFSTRPGNDIVLAFTASATASNYLIVRSVGAEPTFVPVDGTAYSAGLQGSDEILDLGSGQTYTDAAAQVDQDYYYAIYAFNGSGASAAYLTTQPLKGRIKLQSGATNAGITVDETTNSTSAGFPDAGVNITFPEGVAQETSLTVTKEANQPAANFYVQPNVRRVSPLYFEIEAAPQEPGNYILTLDFSSLGLDADQWNNFVVLKRADASSPWVNIEDFGAVIVNRQTDGVWGKFTISGLNSFSQFAGGEKAESHTVTSTAAAGAGTLRGVLEQALAGDIIQFDVVQMDDPVITVASPIVIDKDITIRGAGNEIVLDGNNATRVLEIAADAVVRIESLRIQNGNDNDNEDMVGGILNEGQLTLVNSVVSGNEATGVVDGLGGVGGILQEAFTMPKLVLINSTIAGNTGADDTGVGGMAVFTGTVEIYNSIIYGNTGDDADAYFDTGIAKSYNSLYGFAEDVLEIAEGSNNLFAADPLFAGTGEDPYQLSAGSPAIDAGDNSYIYEQFDVSGEGFGRKINGTDHGTEGTVDIGAYEYVPETVTYTVTYDGNDATVGSAPADAANYEQGSTVTVLGNTGNLVRSGYTFAGWNTAADGSGTGYEAGANFVMGAANITLYAVWTANPTYTVTYDGNGATGGSTTADATNYEEGATVTVLGNTGSLVRTGYTFDGWNKAAEGSGTSYTAGATFAMGAANATLYAVWTANPTYTVTYDGNGATGGSATADAADYEQGATVTVLGNTGNLVRMGYTLVGWNTAANGSGTGFTAGATFAMGVANFTLYAVWIANPTYTVTYDGNGATGGSVPTDAADYEEGATVTVLGNTANLVRSGYTLVGWNTAANGSGTNYAPGATFVMGAANVMLYARWNMISSGDDETTPTPPPTTETKEELITVDVETGNRGEGAIILQTPIKRTTEASGLKRDEVIYDTERARETVQTVRESGQNTARIVIPDAKDEVSQVEVAIPMEAVGEFARDQINLEVFTDNARIVIPQSSLQNLNEDIFFRLVPIKEEAQRRDVEERARVEQIILEVSQGREVNVVARPMTIETNLQSRAVDLILPLRDVVLPENAEERAKFLAELGIFIEHSDGERVLVKPEVVNYGGQKSELGLQFRIAKFSTFTIVHMEGWQDEQHFHQAYISGYPDGTFQPDRAVTRAEITAMLARNIGSDNERKRNLTTPIPDVPATHWAAADIAYMQELGLLQGDPDGNFRPDDAISRAEMATLAASYKDLTVNKDIQNSVIFPDVTNHWAASAIDAAQQAGLLHGYPDGAYRPGKSVTRAEAVTLVNRLFSRGPFYGVETATWQDALTNHWAFADIEEASQDHYYIITEEGYEMLQN